MGQVTITIDKREYAIKCGDGEEAHIMKLSRILDEKAKLLNQSVGLINENMMLAMVGLILADELEELKNRLSQSSPVVASTSNSAINESIEAQISRINSLIKSLS